MTVEYYQVTVDKFQFKVRNGYYYSDKDSWVKIENNSMKVGVSDFLQTTLGDVVFIELLEVGTEVKQLGEMGQLESIKAVIPIISPVSGIITEVNQELEDTPELINEDPYGSAWMIIVKPSNMNEDLKRLLDAESYFELMKRKIESEQKSLKQGGI